MRKINDKELENAGGGQTVFGEATVGKPGETNSGNCTACDNYKPHPSNYDNFDNGLDKGTCSNCRWFTRSIRDSSSGRCDYNSLYANLVK